MAEAVKSNSGYLKIRTSLAAIKYPSRLIIEPLCKGTVKAVFHIHIAISMYSNICVYRLQQKKR